MSNKAKMSNFNKQLILLIIAAFLLISSVKANTGQTVKLEAPSCELYAAFCLPLSSVELNDYQILNNGAVWDGDLAPCALERLGNKLVANAVALKLPVGNHQIVLKGKEELTFEVEVTCEELRQKSCKDVIDAGRAINTQNNSLEIEIAPSDLLHYSILVDGEAYKGRVAPAQIKTKDAYNMRDLFGDAFFVESFEINGQLFQGAFVSPMAFLQQLNEWDVKGNWTLNDKGLLVGGHNSQVYSNMVIAKKSTGDRFLYEHFTLNVANASSIQIQGNGFVEVKHYSSGCSDSISLNNSSKLNNGTASR